MSMLALISDMFERQGLLRLDDKQLDFNNPSIQSAKRMRIRLRSTIDAHRILTHIKRHDNTGWPPTNSEIHNVDDLLKSGLEFLLLSHWHPHYTKSK